VAAITSPSKTGTAVESLRARAFEIPTGTEQESDGTLTWDSTTVMLVEAHADGLAGIGYTYCHAAAALIVTDKLASAVEGCDALMPERAWAKMQVGARQLGHAGIAAMAISAVDVALWDLKARLLGVCLADALPRFHEAVPIYGSGGFTNYSHEQLRDQVRGWVSDGFDKVKVKVGRDKSSDPERVEVVSAVAGPGVTVMVDGNGAYTPEEALRWAKRFSEQGVAYFEEPVSSEDLRGLAAVRAGAPPGMSIAAGEYGWDLPYFGRMLEADAVHILQADVTRCGGITNMLRVDGLCKATCLPFSAHCAPAVSAHTCCAMETLLHLEYFFDHYRIEGILFEGTLNPSGGKLAPDRTRPGLGLELNEDAAERYEVPAGGLS
jgi:L-alanine-DL-glutamate epimerase-like enolase superfamily enzyme